MSVLWQLCSVIVLAAGSGGIPVPCKQDVCLEGFTNKTFHRLRIECDEVTTDLTMDGDLLDQNVSFLPGTGCITWSSGSLSDCKVTETLDSGKKTAVSFTYNCTAGFDLSTTAASADEKNFDLSTTPAPTVPTAASADKKKRHHLCTVPAAAAAAVVLLLISLFCSMKYFRCQNNVKHKPPSFV